MRRMIAATLATSIVALAGLASAQEWGGEQDEVRKGELGKLWGHPVRYDLRTQYASLSSSYVRFELGWYDPYEKSEVFQVLVDDERAAHLEQYQVRFDRKKITLELEFPCPQDRKDKVTICTERFVWQKNSREFELVETTSTNPVAETQSELFSLIRKGKFEQVTKSIERLRAKHGDEEVPWIPLFNAFVERLHGKVVADLEKRDYELASRRAQAFFVLKPPMSFPEGCPDFEKIVICLGEKDECGCEGNFGQLEPTEEVADMFEDITRALYKDEEYELAVRLGNAVLKRVPEHTGLLLVMADTLWEMDEEEKAREHYAAVRRIRWVTKKFIPKRVFDRFRAPKDK